MPYVSALSLRSPPLHYLSAAAATGGPRVRSQRPAAAGGGHGLLHHVCPAAHRHHPDSGAGLPVLGLAGAGAAAHQTLPPAGLLGRRPGRADSAQRDRCGAQPAGDVAGVRVSAFHCHHPVRRYSALAQPDLAGAGAAQQRPASHGAQGAGPLAGPAAGHRAALHAGLPFRCRPGVCGPLRRFFRRHRSAPWCWSWATRYFRC